jgi:hypothetical protein
MLKFVTAGRRGLMSVSMADGKICQSMKKGSDERIDGRWQNLPQLVDN